MKFPILIATALALCSSEMTFSANESTPPLDADSYNQWKEALKAGKATPVERITALPGFKVELLRSAGPNDGSWVALVFDHEGRAIISREDKGLLRLNLKENSLEMIESTLAEVRGLIFVNGMLFAHANNSKSLVRLRDADSDGKYEEIRTLKETPGGVGHGRNQISLGPEGALYVICGDDVKAPASGFDPDSPFQHAAEDKMLPAPWDKFNWSDRVTPPVGHLVKTDLEGKSWQIVCGGLRNPFGLAFNREGEAFTYDADIEWDIGLPWYRPTRIIHLLSGADYGWRGGSRALPAWFPDTTPAVVDIGKGSPTGCVFGSKSAWPARWKDTLFALDWAYGRIHAVTLTPQGGSYSGKSEIFLEGRPLNITTATFGPDGQMYFVTGGRRTQSGLYRVSWQGDVVSPTAVASEKAPDTTARHLRHELTRLQGKQSPGAIDKAWPHLASDDKTLRQAARTVIESQPLSEWLSKYRAETSPTIQAELALALARVGGPEGTEALWKTFPKDAHKLPASAHLRSWIRALQLAALRQHDFLTTEKSAALQPLFPLSDPLSSRLLAEILVEGKSPEIVAKALPFCEGNGPQKERLHYLFTLGHAQVGWALELRRRWLKSFISLRTSAVGGPAVPQQLDYLRAHFISQLTSDEQAALASERAAAELTSTTAAVALPARPFVKAWTTDQLVGEIAALKTAPNLERGKTLFAEVTCAQCHRVGTMGAQVGPDLTAIGSRFDRRALIESIIEPWKVIADQYRIISVTTKSGAIHTGRLVTDEADVIQVATNPIEPTNLTNIPRTEAASVSSLSSMPPALLYSLSAEEARDLLTWLESAK